MNNIYLIKNSKLEVSCDDGKLSNRLKNWLNIFEVIKVDKEKIINSISIKNGKIRVVLNNDELLNSYLETTDLYPIVMNMLANLIDDNDNILLHSTVISKDDYGILLLGTFGVGKTYLSLIAEQNGYIINSADFSWLKIKGNELILVKGSNYLKYDNDERFLTKKYINSHIAIKSIVFLVGMCDGNNSVFEEILNNNYIMRKMFPFANWHSSIPLISDNVNLPLDNIIIKECLFKFIDTNKNFISFRGDSNKLISIINDRI